ncbi:thiamine pyrophosphate-binding protein [Ramlibacter ginsenosidimutans]|uniref:Thiamine pyrophosphate-binding protein n=1 Tax=Ramlibacter ginsenosidimutans TaxID=502333 RepID=A0A934WQ12_9BURK|nr:thiamine pyrophosphate-binding protein [Ramlibacter ginsenosidimutans]MBK6008747.1 thiamine pyrophosphate-binding protein [Ramlibacter ginsenosidimutans]
MANGTTPKTPTAGRVLVDALRLHGVDRVFCVPGESYLEVLDALYDARSEIQLVVAKHEGGAANMADADGKLTGRPGICMVTRGPGATHASAGVHTAQQDSTPMILFVGQIARNQVGRDAFQEVDYHAMFGKLAKWVVEVNDASRMAEIVARAFHVAVSGRPGPVVVSLPEDVLTEACAVPAVRNTPLAPAVPDGTTMNAIASMLAGAQRPLVIVGGSGWSDEAAAALAQFAAAWDLPVASSFRRQDIFDNSRAQYVGHLSLGMNPALKEMVTAADVILAVGTRLADITTDSYTLLQVPLPRQRLIHLHPDAAEIGRVYRPEIGVTASVGIAATAFAGLRAPPSRPWSAWTRSGRQAHEAFVRPPARSAAATGVDFGAAMRHVSETLPADAIISNGAGNYTVWVHRFHQYQRPRTELAPTSGSMGYGLPAAVAASLRHPDRDVVCIAGDGCFLMYPQELATAAEYGARFIVLVVNNGMYGTIRMHQENHYPGRVSGTRLQGPDYVALARAFGGWGERVESTGGFAAAFERARVQRGFALLELVTDPRQITPGKRID